MSQIQARYQATPVTVADGKVTDVLTDNVGRLQVVTLGAGGGASEVQGVVADGAAAGATKPVLVGGVDTGGNAQHLRVGTDGKLSIKLETDADIQLTTSDEITVAGKSGGTPVSLSVDGTGRVNTNPVSGQAGITAGAGAVAANTPRVTLASDDPGVTSLQLLDNAVETNRFATNPISGQVGIQGGAGVTTALTTRVAIATDANVVDTELPAAAALADATANPTTPLVGAAIELFNGTTWDRVRGDTTNGLDVDVTRLPVAFNVGDSAATAQRVVLATVPTATMSQVVVGAASTQIAAANANRKTILIRNSHATDAVVINAGAAAVSANHFHLPAGSSVTLETRQVINGIRSAGNDITVHVIEEAYA